MEDRILRLKRIRNMRDLGGLQTEDGYTVVGGKLFRSGKLSKLPQKTQQAVTSIGIRSIIDLRTDMEREESPDAKIDGLTYYNLPILCAATPCITHEKSMYQVMRREGLTLIKQYGTVDYYMRETYRTILFNKDSQKKLAQFLRIVIESDDAILWHCTSGKDRAGLSAMLIESLLGVRSDDIVADYVLSKYALRWKFARNRIGLAIAPIPRSARRILNGLMRIRAEYIIDVATEIKETFGSIINYCKECLSVTDEDIQRLRNKYLVKTCDS